MTVLAKQPARPRKRAKPSFDAPADVTSTPESGWVFRSDAPAPASASAKPEPSPPPVAVAPEPPKPALPPPPPPSPPPAPPAAAVAPVVMAPVIESESPLRFAWVPLAIGISTILAMLPRRREKDEQS